VSSIRDDLALLCTKVVTGPSYRQWLQISTMSGYSPEVAEHELREAILSGEVIATFHQPCGEFHLLPAERT
jgi:hypothetical protein